MTSPPLGAALVLARRHAVRLPAVEVALADAPGRVLADDVVARADLPAANASAMDGWAVRAADLPGVLRVVGESRAGAPWPETLAPGEAVRISTGALVPGGADTILRAEEGTDDGHRLRTDAAPGIGLDIRFAAEDLRRGHPVLRAGTVIGAHHIGALAASGHGAVPCLRRPTARVVTTGSELVPPGGPTGRSTIFDSNGPGLTAQLRAAGADVTDAITVDDDPRAVRDAVAGAITGCDLLLVAGGLSVGRHDHVRAALEYVGTQPVFTRLAMRPGRPTTLGRVGPCRVLAVPGNPAAAAVGTHLLGRALLRTDVPWTRMPLGTALPSARRLDEVVRCRDEGGHAVPLPDQGSGSVSSVAGADLLAWLPWGRTAFPAGASIWVSRL